MALGKKQVVVYTALAVVVGIALIIGVVIVRNVKIFADVPSGSDTRIEGITAKKWQLISIPCSSPRKSSDILGGGGTGKQIFYDNSGAKKDDWVKDSASSFNKYTNIGNALWVYAMSNQLWWKTDAAKQNGCTLPADDSAVQTVALKAGEYKAVGNPFIDRTVKLKDITATYTDPTTSAVVKDKPLAEMLVDDTAKDAATQKQLVQLAFYNQYVQDTSKDTTGYETISTQAALKDKLGGDDGELAIGQSFYVVFAPSLTGDISLSFKPSELTGDAKIKHDLKTIARAVDSYISKNKAGKFAPPGTPSATCNASGTICDDDLNTTGSIAASALIKSSVISAIPKPSDDKTKYMIDVWGGTTPTNQPYYAISSTLSTPAYNVSYNLSADVLKLLPLNQDGKSWLPCFTGSVGDPSPRYCIGNGQANVQ